jgi:hypothetical protein
MARMGYLWNTARVGRDARLGYRFLFPHKAAKQDIHSE